MYVYTVYTCMYTLHMYMCTFVYNPTGEFNHPINLKLHDSMLGVSPAKGATDGQLDLSEAAGRRYASVYALKLKDQPYDEMVLSKIESSASVRWLAKWRLESHLEISSNAQLAAQQSAAATSVSSQWRAWMDWATGTDVTTSTHAGPKEAWGEGLAWGEGFDVESLLNEVDSELPELATPTRFELHMQIAQYTALCDASGHQYRHISILALKACRVSTCLNDWRCTI